MSEELSADPYLDSLRQELSIATGDSIRFELLFTLADEMATVQAESCLVYTQEALPLAQKLDYHLIIPYLINLEGMSYDDLGRYADAIDAYERAIEATYNAMRDADEEDQKMLFWDLVIVYNNLGYSLYNQGAYENAMKYYLRAIDIGKDYNCPDLSLVYGSVAELYFALDDIGRARQYVDQAIAVATDSSTMLFDASLLGQIYLAEGKLDSAEAFFNRLLSRGLITNYDRVVAHQGLAETHLEVGHIEEALEHAERCYQAARTLDNKIFQASALALIAQCQLETGQDHSAATNLREAIRISEESNSRPDLDKYYSLLSSYYRLKGDYRNAYEYEMKAKNVRETLRSRERSDYFIELAVDRQIAQSEEEAAVLKTRLEYDQKIIRNSVSFGIAMFFFFLLVVFVMYLLMRFRTGRDIRKALKPVEQMPSDKRRFLKGVTIASAIMMLPLILHSIVWNNQETLYMQLVALVFISVLWLLAHYNKTNWVTSAIMLLVYPFIATTPLHSGTIFVIHLAIPAAFIVVAYSLEDYRIQLLNALLAMGSVVTLLILMSRSQVRLENDPSGHQIMIGLLCLGAIFITLYYYHGHIRDYRAGLRAANQFLRQISDINPHFVFAKDNDRRYTFVNASMTAAYATSSDAMIGKRDEEILPEDDARSRHRQEDEEVLSESVSLFTEEEKFVTVEGQEMWVQTIKKPILDDEGDVDGLLGVATDITARRQANVELQRSNSLLMATFDSTADGLLVVNLHNEIVDYNSKFREMWGLSEEILEENESAAIESASAQLKDPDQVINGIEEIYANPEAKIFDTLYFKDGRVYERYSQVQKVGDEIVGRVWSFRDVTDRERAVSNLQVSEERYRYVFENTNQAIVSVDAKTYYPIDCNHRTLEMLGLDSKEDFLRTHACDLFAPPDLDFEQRQQHCSDLVRRVLSEGQVHFAFERTDVGRDHFAGDVVAIKDTSTDEPRIWLFISDITDLTLTNESLRRSESRYRAMLDDNLFPIFTLRKSQFTSVNEAVAKVTGYTQSELLGMQADQIVLSEDLPAYSELAQKIYSGQQPSGSLTIRFRRKDGSKGYMLGSVKAHYNEVGEYIESVVTAADISQLKQAEQERLDAELRYRTLFERYPLGIILINPSEGGKGVTANVKILELFSSQMEEINQNSLLHYSPPKQPEGRSSAVAWQANVEQATEEHSAEFEWQFMPEAGEPFIASVVYQPIVLEGKCLAMVMVQDITQLKIAEEERMKSQSTYRSLVEASPDGIVMTDVSGHITFASDRMLEMTRNENIERILGRHILDFSIPEEKEQAKISMGKVFTSDTPVFNRFQIRMADGILLPVEIGARSIAGTSGDIYGLVLHVRDITDQIETEGILKESEMRYRLLFETTFDGLLIVHHNGMIIDANYSALELFEYPSTEILSERTLDDLFPGIFDKVEYRAIVAGDVGKTSSIRVKGRDYIGQDIFAEIHFCLLPVAGSQHIACAIRNVAEKVIMEKQEREIASQQVEMDALNREIASYTLFSSQRNRLLSEIQEEVRDALRSKGADVKNALRKVTRKIDNNLNDHEDMLAFKIQFEKIHPNFFQRLLKHNPKLTNNDMKYCAYIRLNMSTQEICNLLYVEKKSVEMAKYRIKKKLQLSRDQKLSEFIHSI
jgi:PAS domain S-box-containing protein